MTIFLKKFIIIFIIVIITGSVAVFYFVNKKDTSTIDFIIAEKKDIVQEVNVIGRVKPSESVDLAFEEAGQVISAPIAVGDLVYRGQTLVQLKNGENRAELAKAEADVSLEEAKLEELVRGYTPEEIEVQRVKVTNAESSLTEAKRNLIVKLSDAFTKTDDAVRNNVDQFISNSRSSNPQISFLVSDASLESSIEFTRISIESMLNTWSDEVVLLTIGSDLSSKTENAKQNLSDTKEFLDEVSLAVNVLTASANLSQTTIDGYRSDVSTARTNVNTALSNISVAQEKLQEAESALALEQQELMLKTTGTRSEQITAQEAKVEKAKATIRSRQAEIDKTYLITPISGIVTLQDAKVGEIVSARTVIVSIISEAEFEIEAKVPEADIAKININDPAKITLDAYGSDILFQANVVSVDPAEKIIEGVATYKTVLQFTEKDERVRSGMTANIDIKTGEKSNIIAIPARAVITKNGQKIVRVLDTQDIIIETPVTTGLRSSEGSIEIIEGISVGDKVIVFLEK